MDFFLLSHNILWLYNSFFLRRKTLRLYIIISVCFSFCGNILRNILFAGRGRSGGLLDFCISNFFFWLRRNELRLYRGGIFGYFFWLRRKILRLYYCGIFENFFLLGYGFFFFFFFLRRNELRLYIFCCVGFGFVLSHKILWLYNGDFFGIFFYRRRNELRLYRRDCRNVCAFKNVVQVFPVGNVCTGGFQLAFVSDVLYCMQVLDIQYPCGLKVWKFIEHSLYIGQSVVVE